MPAPTPAGGWNPGNQTVTLPSGNVAELRPALPTFVLLRSGVMNKDLFAAFEQWQEGKLDDPSQASELLDLIVTTMFVSPVVTHDGAGDSLPISQLTDDDIDRVLELAVGGLPDEAFPDEPEGAGGSQDGEKVGADPVKPARGRARKSGGAKGGQRARAAA